MACANFKISTRASGLIALSAALISFKHCSTSAPRK
jgi:hypothetical protein